MMTRDTTCLARLAAVFAVVCAPLAAEAQLVAFPGAEGAGKYAKGGRDGDVYIVTNLNNSGPGSLRYGVDTSPSAGRTIVFSVGGTINLTSDLDIDRPNITIAGQTAPAPITLAHRALRVSDTHDVIVQHIAVRPGDYYTAPNVYEPDSIWVPNSQDVILDHVSASWSTDEVLSVTHGSTNVTVQWSLITEALHNSNHSKGNHGYGSIFHGGETTLHHNLYAHNRSRNPALGNFDKSAPINPAHLDVVNNVIFNPGDRYSYSGGDDQYEVNWANNFGIEGPNTSRENELFHPDNTNTLVYYNGNYYDTSEDGILQLNPAPSSTLTGTYTPLGSPSPTTNPPAQTDAPTAYMHVLSYAGSSALRDAIDSRVIDTVLNQGGDHLDSQDEVGGWLYPTANPVALDPDGLPDWWKVSKGLDPDDNAIGLQKPAGGGGYTYLEMYLHELNAPFMPPAATTQGAVSTAYGAGADATITENSGASGGDGTGATLSAAYNRGSLNEMIELKFDLARVVEGSVADATLELTAWEDLGSHTLRVYGLKHGADDQDWDESTIEFDDAPGVEFDGSSTTRGLLVDDLVLLGEFSTSGVDEGETTSFTGPDLSVFLNTLAYRQTGPADLVTLLVQRQTTSGDPVLFASKESTTLASGGAASAGDYAPRLVLDAVFQLPGDFNDDGVVDAADYTVWRDGYNTIYSDEDYLTWVNHFGETLGSSSTTNGGPASVPEPTTGAVLLGLLTITNLGRNRGSLSPATRDSA